jgi:hypothetical protein
MTLKQERKNPAILLPRLARDIRTALQSSFPTAIKAGGCDDAIARSAFVLRMIGVIQPLGGFIP